MLGFGPLEPLLRDASISEVMVNAPDTVFYEKEGRLYLSSVRFRDDQHIMRIVERIVAPLGRRVDESSPMVDARLPDGSRVNVIIPPVAPKSPTITIRKFRTDKMTINDLVATGALTNELAEFFRACVQAKLNILISGGTGTGKTTMLNALSAFIPDTERIVTIEDPTELQLQQGHVVTLEARPAIARRARGEVTQRDLVRNSLRMRPDRIIVGEVRGPEAFDMLQAMNTGHEGSLGTVHANTPRDALARIENMVMMAGFELPVKAIREQMQSAIHVVIQIARFPDGTRKVTTRRRGVGHGGPGRDDAGPVPLRADGRRHRRPRARRAAHDRHPAAVRREVRGLRHSPAVGPLRDRGVLDGSDLWRPSPRSPSWPPSSWLMFAFYGNAVPPETRMRGRLEGLHVRHVRRRGLDAGRAAQPLSGKSIFADSASGNLRERSRSQLERADMTIRPGEYIVDALRAGARRAVVAPIARSVTG